MSSARLTGSHVQCRCPACGLKVWYPPPLSGMPRYWCPSCTIFGRDSEMQVLPRMRKFATIGKNRDEDAVL